MPSATTSLRRPRDEQSDDDQESFDASTPSTSGSSSKKARLNRNGDAFPSSPKNPSSGTYSTTGPHSSHVETLHSRPSRKKHQPGSILRVKLTDFVTYTAVEFSPGPSLNMVIGPNGTGKSTLVCAICLGLGWGAQHLGRAKDVGEFVKHGCQEAIIEIELAGDRVYPEAVIRCRITREGNKTAFYFNGSPSSKKEILKVARHFTIQIDNLCQFLPQDKVVEFAAMTPIELLRSTQRAVAPQEMLDMHDGLKELRKTQKKVEEKNASCQETLASLENKQRMQQADVDRMRERNEIQQRITYLEKSRPIWQYRDALAEFNLAREKRKAVAGELKDLEREAGPALRAVNAKQAYEEAIEQVVKERKQITAKAEKNTDNLDRKLRELHERGEVFMHERQAESEAGRKSKTEIARIEGNIMRLKKQIEEPPPDLDISTFNERIREYSRKIDEYVGQARDIQKRQVDNTRIGREKSEQVHNAQRDLQNLESQAGQRNRKLHSLAPDTYRAWEWLQKNQDKFEKKIFGPPLVECSIKDARYADQIESLFGDSHFFLFTSQSREDFAKFTHIMHEDLKLANVNTRPMTGRLDEFRPPVGMEELRRYGLEGWALDCIDGPEPVLAMLAYELKLHATAISSRDSTPREYEDIQKSAIDNWVTSRNIYKITRRREYGPSATTASVRNTRKASRWTDQPVDMSAKRRLQEDIQGWTEEKASLEQQNQELTVELAATRERISDFKGKQADLMKEKQEKQKILGEIKALPTKLAQQEEKLDTVQKSYQGVKDRINAAEEKQDAVNLERGRVALDYTAAVEVLRAAHNELHIAALMNIEATSDVQNLMQRNSAVKKLLTEKGKEVEEWSGISKLAKEKAKATAAPIKDLMEERKSDPAYDTFFLALPENVPGEEMEEEVSAEKARLELTHEGNGNVIKEYEQRQQRVDLLKQEMEEGKGAFDDLAEQIKSVRDRWEPELDKLVEKISRSFSFNMSQINCAGEVSVFKDDFDFDAWAIQILVKFRESEPLTQLDSHRQSGGERAVSTIFYLMSLQTLTRSPFRVVDEINQGMDPRNERLVHKRMVDIACGTSSRNHHDDNDGEQNAGDQASNGEEEEGDGETRGGSQYFLITPKLLHGLDYARGMRVLCIASGEKMPSEKSKIDFGKCVDIARGMRGMGLGMGMRAADVG